MILYIDIFKSWNSFNKKISHLKLILDAETYQVQIKTQKTLNIGESQFFTSKLKKV